MDSAIAAFAVASILAVLALVTLGIKSWLEWQTDKAQALGQSGSEPPVVQETDTIILAKSLQ
jgi:hypothetical protein